MSKVIARIPWLTAFFMASWAIVFLIENNTPGFLERWKLNGIAVQDQWYAGNFFFSHEALTFITAHFLHLDIYHLGVNIAWAFFIVLPLEFLLSEKHPASGRIAIVALYLLAGISVAFAQAYIRQSGCGASGGLCGLLATGLFVAYNKMNNAAKAEFTPKTIGEIFSYMLCPIFLMLASGINVFCDFMLRQQPHLAGFLTGAFLLIIFLIFTQLQAWQIQPSHSR